MSPYLNNKIPDPFGDDEDVLDIHIRPATPDDFSQVSFLAVSLLNQAFGKSISKVGKDGIDIVHAALTSRLRTDCTWIMHEGSTVIGMIDIETVETRRLNGPSIIRTIVDHFGLAGKVIEAGLLPLLVYEPAPDEAHQSLVALLPGSRGEGRGTLLLMHGAFWARAQGKNWMTAWLPAGEPVRNVYERRNYFIDREFECTGAAGAKDKWILLRKPISAAAHKIMRTRAASSHD